MSQARTPNEALEELRQYDAGAHKLVYEAIRDLRSENKEAQRLLSAEQSATGQLKAQVSSAQQQISQLQSQLQQLQSTQASASHQAAQAQQSAQQTYAALPSNVKVEKPQLFKGQVNANAVETFLYQCELYFDLCSISDDNQQARVAIMFLADDAATWFRSLQVPLSTLAWSQLSVAIRSQFKPIDHERRARDALAECRQLNTVQGYINAFRKALVEVSTVSKEEALDKFIRGLKPYIKKDVLIHAPQDWETAALAAERVAAAGSKSSTYYSYTNNNNNTQGSSKREGATPMELGAMHSSSDNANSNSAQVKLATGLKVLSTCACDVAVEVVPGVSQVITFRVVPELANNFVLGMTWLKQVNPTVDWRRQELRFVHNHVEYTVYGSQVEQQVPTGVKVEICGLKSMCKQLRKQKLPSWFGLLRDNAHLGCIAADAAVPAAQLAAHGLNSAAEVSEKNRWSPLLAEFEDVFAEPGEPPERPIKHKIDLVDDSKLPPRHRVYRMSEPELLEVRRQIDSLLAKGWIRPSSSPYGSPILFARKKDGTLRMCVDYRMLNKNTKIDQYPMPRVDDILDALNGCRVFSKIDLQQGYHQVAIEAGHEFKTAFATKWGLYEYLVVPFGLCNAPATFQRLMNHTFRDKLGQFVLVYLDDILVFSRSEQEHEEHLRWVLQQLRDNKLYAKRTKSSFGLGEVEYLGHIVGAAGVKPDPAKLDAVRAWPEPTNVKQVQQFLGLANYYNRFVKGFAEIAAPLSNLLQKGREWVWSAECARSFARLKMALCSAPVLVFPRMDLDFTLETDASDVAVGGVLEQDQGQGLQPIAYFSRKLGGAELNYPTHDRELMAVFLSVKKFRPYLDGKCCTVITDHKPLVYIRSQPHLTRRQTRWLEWLEEFHLQYVYRPGKLGVAPDALSRINALIVEPGWLGRVHAAQHDTADKEMVKLLGKAATQDSTFHMVDTEGLKLLYRVVGSVEQLVVPSSAGLRQLLLSEMHNAQLAGHLGGNKTTAVLQQRFWWPNMAAEVRRYVASCPVCQRSKDRTTGAPGQLQPLQVPNKRFSCWSMDFVTHLPESNGYNAVLTIVDRLTKLVRLTPLNFAESTAPKVAALFFDRVVRDFGVPADVVSDRDPRWVGAFWRALMAIIGTKLSFSSAHHPQSDGQTERAHRVLEQVLRSYIVGGVVEPEQWSEVLGQCEFALNASVSPTTGKSAFELVYGEPVSTVVDHLCGNSRVAAAQDFADQAVRLVELAKGNIEQARAYQKGYYDKHHKDVQFGVGERVLLSTKNLNLPGCRKLRQRWVGPFQVLQKVGNVAYKLELPEQFKGIHPTFHVSLLKQYKEPGVGQSVPVAEPIVVNDNVEYEVDSILKHRKRGRRLEFLVKWKGYGIEDSTWLAKQDLGNAQECLQKYLEGVNLAL